MSRVVLVTGSTSGIGAAVAHRFADAGDTVVYNSARSADVGQALAQATPNAHYVQADISEPEDCTRLIAEVISRCGRLDVLVNNAGTTRVIDHRDLAAADVTVWREIFEVNVFGTWNLSVAAMGALRDAKGTIVNVTSLAGVRPTGSSIPYAASKAALNHMTALLAKAVGPDVRVNAVAPGLIDTPWTADWDDVRSAVARRSPLGRSGRPEDVADVVVALAGSAYVTGQVVVVDGGLGLA
ncbi:MAG TPA: SDR family oxidoreductase [Acidimicrobiales bacterium]|nr:SDR family oxidoreductase [Acidimicrobiales bacterium]